MAMIRKKHAVTMISRQFWLVSNPLHTGWTPMAVGWSVGRTLAAANGNCLAASEKLDLLVGLTCTRVYRSTTVPDCRLLGWIMWSLDIPMRPVEQVVAFQNRPASIVLEAFPPLLLPVPSFANCWSHSAGLSMQ